MQENLGKSSNSSLFDLAKNCWSGQGAVAKDGEGTFLLDGKLPSTEGRHCGSPFWEAWTVDIHNALRICEERRVTFWKGGTVRMSPLTEFMTLVRTSCVLFKCFLLSSNRYACLRRVGYFALLRLVLCPQESARAAHKNTFDVFIFQFVVERWAPQIP